MGCSDLLADPHEQSIGIIGTIRIGPDAPYGPYALSPSPTRRKSPSRSIPMTASRYFRIGSGARVPVARDLFRSARDRGCERHGIGGIGTIGGVGPFR